MDESKEDRAARLNRERVARHSKKLTNDKGLVRVSVWVKKEFSEKLKKYAEKLR